MRVVVISVGVVKYAPTRPPTAPIAASAYTQERVSNEVFEETK